MTPIDPDILVWRKALAKFMDDVSEQPNPPSRRKGRGSITY